MNSCGDSGVTDRRLIVRPGNAVDAVVARRALGPGAAFVAGATALQLTWPERLPVTPLVDLSGIAAGAPAELTQSRARPVLRLSCLATLEATRTSPAARRACPGLCDAIAAIAAPGVRHLATIGGNVAWRSGDLVPYLLAGGARVVSHPRGSESLESWLAEEANGSLLLAIELPLPRADTVLFEKIGYRAAFTPSLLTLAVSAVIENGSIDRIEVAVGGGANRPGLLPGLAAQLVGRTPAEVDLMVLAAGFLRSGLLANDAFATASHRASVAARVLRGRLIAAAA
jgi:CO/xanthine dehydrogenase FAD-binding subunit